LPWKRGPAAWKIKSHADEIKARLAGEKRNFFGLRVAAQILNVSTQPVRDWIRLGYLKRTGPRGQITKGELERFIDILVKRAGPFGPENYLKRLPRTCPYQKLNRVPFVWPKGRKTLTPKEISNLISCHQSLVIKAIRCRRLRARRRTPCRWEVLMRA
jgi:hypothetical protein